MHDRRGRSTATFLVVLTVTFVALTIASTAMSSPAHAPSTDAIAAVRTPWVSDPAPTSSTTVPASSPTAVPVPVAAPIPTTNPPPAPSTNDTADVALGSTATPPAEPADLLAIARQALDSVVPAGWFTSAELQWYLLDGSSSLSTNRPPLIEVGRDHFENPAKLRFILAHEWGHHVAFRYGDNSVLPGEPPIGFDAGGNEPAEMWAGCVAEVLVPDYWISTHGLPHCAPEAKQFTANFLAAGPP